VLHRILGILLAVCGVAAITLGVASATIWRTSSTATATTASSSTDATLMTTAPGVLDLVSDTVRISAHGAGGENVVLAIGRTADVDGWVGSDPAVRVTGLADWSTLETSSTSGKAPKTAPDPMKSDMWVASTNGAGTASTAWTKRPGSWTLLVAGTGKDATVPTLSLTWDRTVTTPYLWPLVVAGLALLVVAAVVLALGRSRRRKRTQAAVRAAATSDPRRSRSPSAVGAASSAHSSEPASAAADASKQQLTRRELREQAARLAEQESRRNKSRRAKASARASAPAGGADAAAEPEPTTAAIPVPQNAKGAADAWRRRWNVPARIAPPGTTGDGSADGGAQTPPPSLPWAPTASGSNDTHDDQGGQS
jgi:hypothetical protein